MDYKTCVSRNVYYVKKCSVTKKSFGNAALEKQLCGITILND